MNPIRRATLLAALLASSFGPLAVQAQDFPNKPIKFVVGYAAGGPTDVIARIVGQEVTQSLGQAVIVENRAGANGNIGTESVARAPADGYTLIVNTLSHNVNPLMNPGVAKYDPVKDFTPISLAVVLPQLLVVGYDSPFQTLADLVKAGVTVHKLSGDEAGRWFAAARPLFDEFSSKSADTRAIVGRILAAR